MGLAEHSNKCAFDAALGSVSICQADLGLAELVVALNINSIDTLFQSARQIWVWLNQSSDSSAFEKILFQSARQIWVWLNCGRNGGRRQRHQRVSICQADLGLAERGVVSGWSDAGSMFQSARQIWVWLNPSATRNAVRTVFVSICQADLGLAELVYAAIS